jgi:hypothetical protein
VRDLWRTKPEAGVVCEIVLEEVISVSASASGIACCEMSRRDGAIVAWHEVPGLEFGHFREQKPTARPKELGLLGVERGSQARRDLPRRG